MFALEKTKQKTLFISCQTTDEIQKQSTYTEIILRAIKITEYSENENNNNISTRMVSTAPTILFG